MQFILMTSCFRTN